MTTSTQQPPSTTPVGPVVRTTEGLYEGLDRDGSAAFLGMPFAAAPVAKLRFAAPAPAPTFSGVRKATEFGATPQRRTWGPDATVPEYVVAGDSTLNVNVFTPAPGDESALLPVYVWIHGGGYFSGSPACPWYDGAAFNRDGIVTVSISYRLAFDGFGWIADAPLNRGVLDQIAALEWVAKNIRSFGGDPDDVTIGGQSAGGGSVMTLLAAPAARGLFHRAIAHSPAVSHVTPVEAEEVGKAIAEAFGVESTVAGWSAVPELDIVARERELNHVVGAGTEQPTPEEMVQAARERGIDSIGLVFAPIQDGIVVGDLAEALREGETADVALLIGTTRDELVGPDGLGQGSVSRSGVDAALRSAGLSDEAIRVFDAEVDLLGDQHAAPLLQTSQAFRTPVIAMAELRRAAGDGGSTWLFDFAYHSPVSGHAVHGYDLPFAFDVLDAEGVSAVLGEAPPQTLADTVHGVWARFIATGEPGWPAVDVAVAGAMRFDERSAYDARAYLPDAELAGAVDSTLSAPSAARRP